MPIFEFKCGECGAGFESIALPGQETATSCPECGSEKLEKLFSTFTTPRNPAASGGLTCCGREERCDSPPCDTGGTCRKT